MKLKYRPEDFQVEELPVVSPGEAGRYRCYRLVKRNLGTIEAVAIICRRWNLAGRQVSYAGLKDRHALATQYLSIADGPSRSIRDKSFELEPLGLLPHPYGPQHFRGNRFQVVIRDLSATLPDGAQETIRKRQPEGGQSSGRGTVPFCSGDSAKSGQSPTADSPRPFSDRFLGELEALARTGLPNYFDDQRFGSVGRSGQFIAHAWLRGDHERALKLALAEPNPYDRSGVKAQKAVLRECWGKWPEAKARLPRSSVRSIVTYLVDHPTDYRGAFARMRRELRSLYFSAFQSHLWNLVLARWIENLTGPGQVVPIELKLGAFPFPKRLQDEQLRILAEAAIPLPSSRTPAPTGPLGEAARAALAPFELEWSDIRIKYLKDVFFSKGSRPCWFFPENLEVSTAKDEFHPGRQALHLSFELGKGSYATIMVKWITDVVGQS
jgi:tRNA pseudouridine13 synthase